jgi:hypothetical protein
VAYHKEKGKSETKGESGPRGLSSSYLGPEFLRVRQLQLLRESLHISQEI